MGIFQTILGNFPAASHDVDSPKAEERVVPWRLAVSILPIFALLVEQSDEILFFSKNSVPNSQPCFTPRWRLALGKSLSASTLRKRVPSHGISWFPQKTRRPVIQREGVPMRERPTEAT